MGSKLALCHASTDRPWSLLRWRSGSLKTGSEVPPHRAFVPCGPLAPCFRLLVQFPPLGLQFLLGQEQPASWDAVQVGTALAQTGIIRGCGCGSGYVIWMGQCLRATDG